MADSISDRLIRWDSFLNGDLSVPFLFHVNVALPDEQVLPPVPPLWPEKAQQRIEFAWAQYELMNRRATIIDDDRVPFLSNLTGTEIFAEAFGCRVHRPDDTNPFALPLVHSASEASKVKRPELSTSSLSCLFDIADELHRRGGPGAIMKPVDIQSPMDIVALIWDKADLFVALHESPEAVKELCEKASGLLEDFLAEWFSRYGTIFVAHYPDYVMHGGVTMSVDEVGSVSEDMFREFFRDNLISMSERFGGIGIHCCADARHQWANFREIPGLKLINHNTPPTRDARTYICDSLSFYGEKVAQMPTGWTPEGSPDTWYDEYPSGARIVFEVPADDVESGAMIAERLRSRRGN